MIDKINNLSNIGLRIVLLIFVVLIGWQAFTDDTPVGVKAAEDQLFLGYREHIYDSARCENGQFSGVWVIFCHPDGSETGGIFEVTDTSENFKLAALNGKAQQHAETLGIDAPPNHDSTIGAAEVIQTFKAAW